MLARFVFGAVTAGAMIVPALAAQMNAEEARRFVAGKVFAFTCFDGTRGAGRVFEDGGQRRVLGPGGGGVEGGGKKLPAASLIALREHRHGEPALAAGGARRDTFRTGVAAP